jgi:hypothetical protein
VPTWEVIDLEPSAEDNIPSALAWAVPVFESQVLVELSDLPERLFCCLAAIYLSVLGVFWAQGYQTGDPTQMSYETMDIGAPSRVLTF